MASSEKTAAEKNVDSLVEEDDVGSAGRDEDSPYNAKVTPFRERVLEEEDRFVESVASPKPVAAPSRIELRWSDTTPYRAKKKLQAWCQLSNGDWALGRVESTTGTESVISLPEDKVLKLNPESLLPANPDILDGVDDLMQLSYLNEPSVLYNLEYRYFRDMIYTKAGPVLVAINPLKEVNLYGNEYIEAYRCKSLDSPHVYAIADTAIREMIRGGLALKKNFLIYLQPLELQSKNLVAFCLQMK